MMFPAILEVANDFLDDRNESSNLLNLIEFGLGIRGQEIGPSDVFSEGK
jgi:hypothetical protein